MVCRVPPLETAMSSVVCTAALWLVTCNWLHRRKKDKHKPIKIWDCLLSISSPCETLIHRQTSQLPANSFEVLGKFMSKPSGNSIEVRKRTWPVCPWAEPMGTRGDFSVAAPVPELTTGMARVRTTPGEDQFKWAPGVFLFHRMNELTVMSMRENVYVQANYWTHGCVLWTITMIVCEYLHWCQSTAGLYRPAELWFSDRPPCAVGWWHPHLR